MKRVLHCSLHAVSGEPHCVSNHRTTENRSAALRPLMRGSYPQSDIVSRCIAHLGTRRFLLVLLRRDDLTLMILAMCPMATTHCS